MTTKRRVLFHRSWTKFNGGTSGGQLKVRDAFEHFKASDRFEPYVYFGEETVWFDNPGNYWLPYKDYGLSKWEILPSDILFFAGHDWKILSKQTAINPPVPVLNIAQPRHTNKEDPRNKFLTNPAIRIAKSTIGKQILESYGVNGPVFLIPDAIDMSELPPSNRSPELDFVIVGLKNPELAKKLKRKFQKKNFWRRTKWKFEIQLPPKLPTRYDFLKLVNSAKIVVFLPLEASHGSEGFYLPALEAMAMNKFVICPYAVGNIDFCIHEQTCLVPDYDVDSIYKETLRALTMPESSRQEIIKSARKISENHDIKQERRSLLKLLHSADEIWHDKGNFRFRE